MLLVALAPGAQAARPASTKVTIKSIPSVYGYVSSSKPARCAAHRGVSVFRKKAGKDVEVAETQTRKSSGAWQWSIYGKPDGKIHAKADPKAGCKPGSSKSIKVTAVGDSPAPPCPSLALGICSFGSGPKTAFRLNASSGCNLFSKRSDECNPSSIGGPPAWRTISTGNFHWNNNPGVEQRGVAWYNGDAFFEGEMSSFRSDAVIIHDSRADKDGAHFCTPNLPGKAPGDRGGPLHFNFMRASNVSYYSMYGFMVKKGDDKGC